MRLSPIPTTLGWGGGKAKAAAPAWGRKLPWKGVVGRGVWEARVRPRARVRQRAGSLPQAGTPRTADPPRPEAASGSAGRGRITHKPRNTATARGTTVRALSPCPGPRPVPLPGTPPGGLRAHLRAGLGSGPGTGVDPLELQLWGGTTGGGDLGDDAARAPDWPARPAPPLGSRGAAESRGLAVPGLHSTISGAAGPVPRLTASRGGRGCVPYSEGSAQGPGKRNAGPACLAWQLSPTSGLASHLVTPAALGQTHAYSGYYPSLALWGNHSRHPQPR